MKILLLLEDYDKSYTKACHEEKSFKQLPYKKAEKFLYSKGIYYGNSYLKAFKRANWQAYQIIPSCLDLQLKWFKENRKYIWLLYCIVNAPLWRLKKKARLETAHKILFEQIKEIRPDILFVHSYSIELKQKYLERLRPYAKKIVLWYSCQISNSFPYKSFDLIFSCIPNLVKHFKKMGICSQLIPHSFDPDFSEAWKTSQARQQRVIFAGSLSQFHTDRIALFSYLSKKHVPIDFFVKGKDFLQNSEAKIKTCNLSLWGYDLYKAYASYLLTIHCDIDVAKNGSLAKRLFEATGMGICVLANDSELIRDYFIPDEEIVLYASPEECLEKVRWLLKNPERAIEIGRNGQRRTLKDHTCANRVDKMVQEFSKIFDLK